MTTTRTPVDAHRRMMLRVFGGATFLAVLTRFSDAAEQTTPAAGATTVEVRVDNFVFQPQVLRIRKGTTVRWVNHVDIPHSIVVAALGIHSSPMDTDQSYTQVFEKTGTFPYICGLHPHMKGQVVVSA
jgi:plastocyanin